MDRRIEIFADMVLSFNGEDLHLIASNNDFTVTPASYRSGLRALLEINKHYNLQRRRNTLNEILIRQGWTIYARSGKLKLAILGLKGRRGLMAALLYFSQLCRLAGTI